MRSSSCAAFSLQAEYRQQPGSPENDLTGWERAPAAMGSFYHPVSVGLCIENILFSLLRIIDPDVCLGQLDP